MADKEETEKTIAEDLVVTKYKMAGEIVNRKETVTRVRAGGRAATSVYRAHVFLPSQPYGMRRAKPGHDHVPDLTPSALLARDRIFLLVSIPRSSSMRLPWGNLGQTDNSDNSRLSISFGRNAKFLTMRFAVSNLISFLYMSNNKKLFYPY